MQWITDDFLSKTPKRNGRMQKCNVEKKKLISCRNVYISLVTISFYHIYSIQNFLTETKILTCQIYLGIIPNKLQKDPTLISWFWHRVSRLPPNQPRYPDACPPLSHAFMLLCLSGFCLPSISRLPTHQVLLLIQMIRQSSVSRLLGASLSEVPDPWVLLLIWIAWLSSLSELPVTEAPQKWGVRLPGSGSGDSRRSENACKHTYEALKTIISFRIKLLHFSLKITRIRSRRFFKR
jgi:hypothetical protein